jgi:prepilin-type N-terminal cleavage/methylation domain-containing protein
MSKKDSMIQNTKGFTIVELMISTVVFSLVMVLCLTGMVQVSRAYYKGVTHSRTQEAARLLMDEIAQTIKLSGSAISYVSATVPGPEVAVGSVEEATGVFCAGNKKYTYALDRKVVGGDSDEPNKEIKNAIIREDVICTDVLEKGDLNAAVTGNSRSLIGENMRLTKFSVTRVTPNNSDTTQSGSQLWKIDIRLAYGDQDLLRYTDDSGQNRVICESGTGTEFCSIVELSTIVSRRIG